jgi:hypothetical protein
LRPRGGSEAAPLAGVLVTRENDANKITTA